MFVKNIYSFVLCVFDCILMLHSTRRWSGNAQKCATCADAPYKGFHLLLFSILCLLRRPPDPSDMNNFNQQQNKLLYPVTVLLYTLSNSKQPDRQSGAKFSSLLIPFIEFGAIGHIYTIRRINDRDLLETNSNENIAIPWLRVYIWSKII